jgi:hypothetical protein
VYIWPCVWYVWYGRVGYGVLHHRRFVHRQYSAHTDLRNSSPNKIQTQKTQLLSSSVNAVLCRHVVDRLLPAFSNATSVVIRGFGWVWVHCVRLRGEMTFMLLTRGLVVWEDGLVRGSSVGKGLGGVAFSKVCSRHVCVRMYVGVYVGGLIDSMRVVLALRAVPFVRRAITCSLALA